MKTYFRSTLNFFDTSTRIIDQIFKLNPKHYKDPVKLLDAYRRNRVIVLVNLFGALSTIQYTLQNKIALPNCFITLCVILITFLLLALGGRTHPQVFNVSYNILMGISGPLLANTNSQGFIRGFIGVQTYSLLVLTATGSLSHFFIQCFLQIFYLDYLYQSKLVQTINFIPPEELAYSFIQTSKALFAIRTIILVCSHLVLQSAHENITIAEKGKTEAERQKTFLLGFSHELRNLINSIMGNVKLASMENLTETAKDFLRNADVCGEMLLHLINNILDTGKVEVNDLEINPMPTNIYDTVERTWSICAELIRRKNLKGTLKLQRDLPQMLKIDHYRLTQIFLNIVGNAVKFTERGSVDITVEWINNADQIQDSHFEPHPFDDEDISEGAFEKNQRFTSVNNAFMAISSSHVKIQHNKIIHNDTSQMGILKIVIHDTGSGIEKGQVDKLFQKFVQVTSDTSKRKLGTGLGLFITKELCEKMGGRIKAYSQEGKGSCFIFCLPVLPLPNSREQRIPRELSLRDVHRQENNILWETHFKALIVDDELLSQKILTGFLKKLQCEIVGTAANGQEAVTKYIKYSSERPRESISIVTMDLTMPVMDGKLASEKIREYEAVKGLEPCILIIISGNCSESEMTECLNPRGKIRANAFLKKPATFEEVSKIISQIKIINHGKYSLSQDFIEMRTENNRSLRSSSFAIRKYSS